MIARARRLAVVLAALVTTRAGAQGVETSALDRLSPAARAAVVHLVDSARIAGLPSEAVSAKAAEGVLKGADDARIVAVLRTLVGELGAARDALGPGATSSEIVAAASALHAGVPVAAVRRLAASRPPGRALATPLVVMADLVTRRVPPAEAARAVDGLLRRGAADRDFVALRAAVERDILAGQAPLDATRARSRAIVDREGAPRPPEMGPPE